MKHRWIKIKSKIQPIRIQYMLSISFTFVLLVGIAFMGLALSVRFSSSIEKITIEDNKQIIEQLNLNLDTYLRNMMRISDTLYYHVIKNVDLQKESIKEDMELLYEANRDSLISIAVLTDDGQLRGATPWVNVKTDINIPSEEWFKRAQNKIENLHFSTPHVQNLFQNKDGRYRWVVSLSRAIEITSGNRVEHGVLLVDMSFNGIEQIFQKVNTGQDGYVYLVDGSGEIIYHPRQQLIYSNLIKENNNVSATYEDGEHTETFQGDKRLIHVKTVGYTGWKIISVTPANNFAVSIKSIQNFLLLTVLFTAFLMVLATIILSEQISNPIKQLDESVKGLENGILDGMIYIGGSQEIRHLGSTVDSLVKQMRKLMDDIVKEQEQKRKNELDSLQSQIHPHFLYNTLDSIVWMIECERYEEAIVMVTSLAKLFRISLSKGKTIISVRDELEHVRNYLTIQQKRYKDRFTIEIISEENTLELSTIKLIVQPIVENAIYYGMEYMSGEGEIVIRSYLKQEDLYIDIIDNGPGMTEETVDHLLTDSTRTRKKGSGIGLRNVQERIQLYYGKKYGLEVESEPDEGTKVSIHLPKVTLESEERGN